MIVWLGIIFALLNTLNGTLSAQSNHTPGNIYEGIPNLLNPVGFSEMDLGWYSDTYVSGQVAYIQTRSRDRKMYVVDVSDPANPFLITTADTNVSRRKPVEAEDKLLFKDDNGRGTWVFDTTIPNSPVFMGLSDVHVVAAVENTPYILTERSEMCPEQLTLSNLNDPLETSRIWLEMRTGMRITRAVRTKT